MLNAEAQVTLEERFGLIWIEGELSNLSRPASGHWYFTLKDRTAQVRCAMFKGRNVRVRFTPEAGTKLLLRARVSLYTGRGEFQLIVESMEPAGEGALRLAFEQLRRRLADEGLFDDARKRPLPATPRRSSLITSPSGAALRDLITVLARRWPTAEIVLLLSAVQGDAAPGELVAAFARISRMCEDSDTPPDLVIAGRGGGSLEDLWCFNEEAVARAIAACPVPVISAVGHETDFTIADFVADLRAPTLFRRSRARNARCRCPAPPPAQPGSSHYARAASTARRGGAALAARRARSRAIPQPRSRKEPSASTSWACASSGKCTDVRSARRAVAIPRAPPSDGQPSRTPCSRRTSAGYRCADASRSSIRVVRRPARARTLRARTAPHRCDVATRRFRPIGTRSPLPRPAGFESPGGG